MRGVADFSRELKFFLKQRFAVSLILVLTMLSAYSVWSGIMEVKRQQATIDRLMTADRADRLKEQKNGSDFGYVAYKSFHFTYDRPSRAAFMAMGVRDVYPWKHRIRMLALEGQIYETDAANAELAQSGSFDFAFLLSVIVPLFIILMMHDLRASEKAAGRYDLLLTTSGHGHAVWWSRAVVRACLIFLALFIPFLFGALLTGVHGSMILWVLLIASGQIIFWTLLCIWISAKPYTGPTLASGLLAVWMVTTFVIPPLGDAAIESLVPVPKGGDIVLTQREAVNDAWDLPKEATMTPFVAKHPEWADYTKINRPFEWKWYYAFQQVGDQKASALSGKRREAILRWDTLAGYLAVLSPAALVERFLTRAAATDVKAAMAYQQNIRDFHASLRAFYYPLLFKDQAYDPALLKELPHYEAASD